MKWAVAIAFLAATALATCVHQKIAAPAYERELTDSITGALAAETRFRDVRVSLRLLDATLVGEVDTPSDRADAQALANGIWGARARSVNNRLQVRARLDAIVEHDESSATALPLESVSIRGYLPEAAQADDLPALFSGVSAKRKISSSEVGYFPFVSALPKFDRAGLALLAAEFARLPSIGTLELNSKGILLSGDTFASQKQRLEQLAAAAAPAPAVVESRLSAIDLTEPARHALAQVPGLEQVKVAFNEAYATLSGRVASAELRNQAAAVVRSIRLARLLDDRNLIAVGGMFSATATLGAPGRGSIALAGLLPDESWKARLIASLGRLKPGWTVETGGLRFAASLTPAGWLDQAKFFALFEEFFALPAPGLLRIDSGGVTARGKATPAVRERLRSLAGGAGFTDAQVRGEYELFPSLFHMPEYQRVSQIPAPSRAALEEALKVAQIYFDSGSADLAPAESAKLDQLAPVLREAGAGVALVIGGHADATGSADANERLSRSRAEAVAAALESRGFPHGQCQIESFGSTRAPTDSVSDEERRLSRRVEILIR